jgi:thiol-disulfide isomerase/thioredoxin
MTKKLLPYILCLFCFSATAQLLLPTQVKKMESVKPWIGIGIDKAPKGVLIKNAFDGTPAAKAGLTAGDVVLSIDGVKVSTPPQLIKLVQAKGVGHTVKMKCLDANGKPKDVTLSLVAMPGMTELAEKKLLNKKAPDFKAKVLSAHKKMQKEYQLSKHPNKVKVLEFWATWCGGCMQAHPFVKKYAEANPSIEVVAISNEEGPLLRKFLKIAKQRKTTSDSVYFLQGKGTSIDEDYYVPAYPMFFVVDKKNIIRLIRIGGGSNVDEVFSKAIELSK